MASDGYVEMNGIIERKGDYDYTSIKIVV